LPSFVRIVSFETHGGRFDDRKDSTAINDVLSDLQSKGATIKEVEHMTSYSVHNKLTIALYLIQYEAATSIDV
jgi:hypothetical protein